MRVWSVGFLLFGAVAVAVVPFTDAASAAGAQPAENAATERSGPLYATAGEAPGLESEPFGPVATPPAPVELADHGAPVTGEGGPRFDPAATAVEELVDQRSAMSRSFRRSDGMLEVQVSPVPVAYDAGGGEFELIDTSVEQTREGLAAVRNSFEVYLGSSEEGVAVVLPSGERVTSRPATMDGAAPERAVEPEVDESDDSVVWYRQVWPGVDLRYTVRVGGLAEDVVYTEAPEGAGAVSFAVSGAELDAAWSVPAPEAPTAEETSIPQRPVVRSAVLSDLDEVGRGEEASVEDLAFARSVANAERPPGALPTLQARGDLQSKLQFGPLAVLTGDDEDFVDDAVARPLVRSSVSAPGESLVELSLDASWMQTLPADAFPVVLDPDVTVGALGWISYLGGTTTTCGSGSPYCGMRVGFPNIPGFPWSLWRSIGTWNLASQASTYGLTGAGNAKLVASSAILNRAAGSAASSTVRLYEPNAFSWAGVAGWLKGTQTSTSQYTFDVTAHMKAKFGAGTTAVSFGLESDASSYNYKDFSVGLRLVINDAPPAAPLVAPTTGQAWFAKTVSAAPKLTVGAVSDTTFAPGFGGQVQYQFAVSTTPPTTTGYTGNVATRGLSTDRNFQLSPTNLKDGHTYYWRAWTYDGIQKTPSSVFTFRFDRRLGTSGPSPYTDVGPVKVNAATGNAMFTWSQRGVATLGGGASVSMTYNSLLSAGSSVVEATPGLPPGWMASWGSLPVTRLEVTPGGSAVVRLADGGKDAFTWSSNRWTTVESFQQSILRTTSSSPATYQWESPSGWVVNFDAAGNVTTATHHGDDVSPTSLGYEWGTAGSNAVLRKVIDPVVPADARAMAMSYGGDAGCPTSPPAGLSVAPAGLLCKIVHMDGSTAVFWYTTSGGSDQIARIVDDANGNLATGTDDQAVWDLGWNAQHRIASIRDPQTNRQVAAGVLPNSGGTLTNPGDHRVDIGYDADGRVAAVTGAKPDATHVRPGVAFAYPSETVTTATDLNRSEPNGFTTRWTLDERGRAIKVEDRMGRASHTKWVDATTDRVSWTDTQSLTAAGATSFLRTGTVYDDRGRPIEEWGPALRSEFGATTEANGNPSGGANTPRTSTEYDGGLSRFGLTYWSNTSQAGKPVAHGQMASHSIVTTGTPHALLSSGNNWSVRASGSIRFPAAGTYVVRVVSYGPVRYQIGAQWHDSWSYTDPGGTGATTTTMNVAVAAAGAGKWQTMVIDAADASGTGGFQVDWTPPGGSLAAVPAAHMRPEFGLVTKTTARVDASTSNVTAVAYDDPATASVNESYLGIPRVTTADPGGAARQTVETFEASAPGSFLRRIARQLPSGAGSKVTYEYYDPTSTPIASGATECGVGGSTPQLGMLKRTLQADPDGAGPETALVREYVYDAAGRQAGYRSSTDVTSEPWTCTSFDDAGRVDSVEYPAWGGQPARTVDHDYAVGGNPNVTSVDDPAGTVTTTTDWAGRTVSTTDVWGFATTVAYDDLGRVTTASNPAGAVGYSYNADDLVTQQSVNAKVVATPTYDSLGRMNSVSYPAGAGNGANGTSGLFSFDDRGLPKAVAWVDSASGTVTSDDITSRDQIQRVVNRSTDGFDPNGATANYTYSSTGELVSAVGFAAPPAAAAATRTVTYSYAASGGCGIAATAGRNVNRTAKTVDGATPITHCYDHADRLTATSDPFETVSAAAGTLDYDTHGNTSRLGDETHVYDIAGRHLETAAAGTPNAATAVQLTTASDRCFDVEGPSSADGAILQQWGCDSPAVSQQTWDLVAADGEWFNLVSHLAGKCMGPAGGATADGTKFTQRACDQTDQALQFKLVASGSGWRLVSRPTGKCVDVPSGSSSYGVDLQLLACGTGTASSKQFTLNSPTSGSVVSPDSVEADTASGLPSGGFTDMQLRSRGAWKCGDVRGPSSADDTVIQHWSCVRPAVSQQSVDLVADGATSEMRLRFRNANKCAQARTGDTVTQNTCDGGSDQRWKFTERNGGWRIQSTWNNKCLTATGGDGTGLTLSTCADTATQLWSITDPDDGSIIDVDADGDPATTVTYTRDASDQIVERAVDGTVTGRYAATTSGAPSATLNTSNQPISATVALPGGTSHSYNPALTTVNGTWHHPNLTGHRVATTNTTGTKVGATTVYDPDGNLATGALPDDKPGNFDATWHGGGGVNLEHQAGLHPMIQMGARQYSPTLARFLSVDPVEGGGNNDYGYVEDPANQSDPTGTGWCPIGRNPNGSCRGSGVTRAAAREVWQTTRFGINAANATTALGHLVAQVAGASCSFHGGELIWLCTSAKRLRIQGGFMIGNVFITGSRRRAIGDRLIAHEAKHADQWAIFGPAFGPMYVTAYVIAGQCNVFERWAGYRDGGYTRCLPAGIVK